MDRAFNLESRGSGNSSVVRMVLLMSILVRIMLNQGNGVDREVSSQGQISGD